MTIRKTMLAALVLTLPAAGASAQQEPWTLDRCIEYAVENNISIQQFRLRAEDQDVKLNTARNSRLPNLNAGLGGSFGFGRTIGENNTYENVNQFSSNLSVSTSIPLFNGMRIKHDIAAQKLSLQAAMQDLARAREDVSLNVTALYLQALLNKELVRVAESQVALSMAQIERSRLLVESGKSPESELYESRALLAKDSLTLTQARNTLTLSLLDLSQALNREDATGFDIRMPEPGDDPDRRDEQYGIPFGHIRIRRREPPERAGRKIPTTEQREKSVAGPLGPLSADFARSQLRDQLFSHIR